LFSERPHYRGRALDEKSDREENKDAKTPGWKERIVNWIGRSELDPNNRIAQKHKALVLNRGCREWVDKKESRQREKWEVRKVEPYG